MMYVVTTMSYDELGELIKNKSVSLNNDRLIFGQDAAPIKAYLTEHLGGPDYVVAIRGRLNKTSAQLLSQLDRGLLGNKVIVEATISESDSMAFTVKGMEEAADIISYGLPDEILYDHLDQAQVRPGESGEVEIVCFPSIQQGGGIRVSSLSRDISLDASGITIVKLREG